MMGFPNSKNLLVARMLKS